MKYTSVFDLETSENTYLVYDEITLNGVIIDPGCDINKILKMIEDNNVNIKYIFITHCHYDHIKSIINLKEKTGAYILSGDKGAENIGNPDINLTKYGLGYEIKNIKSDIILKDGEILELDSLKFKCIYTPGHTSCGVCYLIDNELFCGDTLFLRNCGRWDLPTGDFKTLEKSIKEKLYVLPDETVVHSGHGHDTNIGYEKKYNFCVTL